MLHLQQLDAQSPFLVMGVVNITPDSFSDGGRYDTPKKAIEHAYRLLEDGADILDFGAESSRPGAKEISGEEEWRRLRPVLEHFAQRETCIPFLSIDTSKETTMLRGADLGISMVNNINGLAESSVLKRLSAYPHLHYAAMHKHGIPETMQQAPLSKEEVLKEVRDFFQESIQGLSALGFSRDRIWLDPGIGFGKSDAANLSLLKETPAFKRDFGNIMVGVSRKGFIGRALDISEPDQRDSATKMLELGLCFLGAKVIRTHEVKTLIGIRKQIQ